MAGDSDAFEKRLRALSERGHHEEVVTLLLKRYGGEILSFLVARLRDPDAAREVFSQFMEDLWIGLPSFEWRCALRIWAYALARHAMSRHIKVDRRQRRRRVPLSQVSRLSLLEQKVRADTLPIDRTEVKTRMAALRAKLPPDDQELLLLRVRQDLDWREIAHVMVEPGHALDTAQVARESARLRKRFQLVKERLRKLAVEEGILGPDLD